MRSDQVRYVAPLRDWWPSSFTEGFDGVLGAVHAFRRPETPCALRIAAYAERRAEVRQVQDADAAAEAPEAAHLRRSDSAEAVDYTSGSAASKPE